MPARGLLPDGRFVTGLSPISVKTGINSPHAPDRCFSRAPGERPDAALRRPHQYTDESTHCFGRFGVKHNVKSIVAAAAIGFGVFGTVGCTVRTVNGPVASDAGTIDQADTTQQEA